MPLLLHFCPLDFHSCLRDGILYFCDLFRDSVLILAADNREPSDNFPLAFTYYRRRHHWGVDAYPCFSGSSGYTLRQFIADPIILPGDQKLSQLFEVPRRNRTPVCTE